MRKALLQKYQAELTAQKKHKKEEKKREGEEEEDGGVLQQLQQLNICNDQILQFTPDVSTNFCYTVV